MSCCQSCALGRPCESTCPDHDHGEHFAEVGDAMPSQALVRLVNGVPVLIDTPKNPQMIGLLSEKAYVSPGMLPAFFAVAQPITGLPLPAIQASWPLSQNMPPFIGPTGNAAPLFLATVAAWKASGPGKSAGWQDPSADAYLEWLKSAIAQKDPTGLAIKEWLTSMSQATGLDWPIAAVTTYTKGGINPNPTQNKTTAYDVATVVGYQDVQGSVYL